MIFVCVVTDGDVTEREVEADSPGEAAEAALEEYLEDPDSDREEGTYHVHVVCPDGVEHVYQVHAHLSWTVSFAEEVADE